MWSESWRYLLLIYRVSFALRCLLSCNVVMLGFRYTVNTAISAMCESIVRCSIYVYDVVVRKFIFAISSSDEHLVISSDETIYSI